MNKLRKFKLITIVLSFLIGTGIGFAVNKFGKRYFFGYALMDWVSIIMEAFLLIAIVYDIFTVIKRSKRIGEIKFTISNITSKKQRVVLLTLTIAALIKAIVSIIKKENFDLYAPLILFAILIIFHLSRRNGIGENGIISWGATYFWDRVNFLGFDDNNTFDLNVKQKVLCFTFDYEIRFIVKAEDKSAIENYLKEKAKYVL